MISRLAAWFAGIVIAATIIFLVAIEIDQRNAPTIEIVVADRSDEIQVEIAGAVEQPGVYRRDRDDRVIDLIDAAGGLLPNADTTSLNQAAWLFDGQRVWVPTVESTISLGGEATPRADLTINLNTASAADFMELPGIGEVRAEAIIAFRNQHGPFQTVEELLFVDGISTTILEGLRPFVTVGP